MRKSVILLILFLFLICSNITPAMAKLLFYDDCESTPIDGSKKWKYAQYESKLPGWDIQKSNKQKRAGSYSYKFVLEPVDPNANYSTATGDLHCQLALLATVSQDGQAARTFSYGKEYWIGYSIFIPSGSKLPPPDTPGLWLDTVDFHGSPDSCDQRRNVPLDVFASQNKLTVRIKAQSSKCGEAHAYDRAKWLDVSNIRYGAWNDIVINFKFSYDPNNEGFVKMWINGDPNPVINDKGINAFNDDKAPFFKMGLYGRVTEQLTVYYDEIRIGGEDSSYDEVSPDKMQALHSQDPDQEEPQPTGLEPPTLKIAN